MENLDIHRYGSFGEEYAICLPSSSTMDEEKIPEINEEGCELFLRQLNIIYHFIHYSLDRPFLAEKEWPHLVAELQKELLACLEADAVPAAWKEVFFPLEPRTAGERKRQKRYASSLRPLFTAAREKIQTALKKLEEIESESMQFTRAAERNSYFKREGTRICQWALQKSWEVFTLLGWEKS